MSAASPVGKSTVPLDGNRFYQGVLLIHISSMFSIKSINYMALIDILEIKINYLD